MDYFLYDMMQLVNVLWTNRTHVITTHTDISHLVHAIQRSARAYVNSHHDICIWDNSYLRHVFDKSCAAHNMYFTLMFPLLNVNPFGLHMTIEFLP